MADTGGESDYEILNATRPREGTSSGWGALGNVIGGGGSVAGQNAYQNGMRIGAQTADALAQARQRIQENQGRTKVAAAIRDPQFQQSLGIDQATAEVMASRAEAGADPADVTRMGLEAQKLNLGNRVAAGGQSGRMAAIALAPASGAIHAEGPNGTFVDPFSSSYSSDTPGGPTNTPVTVGPQQGALDQSEIDLRGAQAKAAGVNANANQTRADKAPVGGAGSGKLQTGFRWKMDPDNPGEVMTDANGQGIQEPNPAAGSSTVSRRYNSAVVNSAALVAKEAENVAHIGTNTTSGGTQIGGTKPGLLNTLGKNMGLALSDDDQQEYTTSLGNVGRALSTIELSGRSPNQATVSSLDKLVSSPGTTQNARLYNFALIRQIAEAGADGMEGNDDATPAAKAAYHKALTSIQKSIPFTPADVVDFRRNGGSQTFQQFLDGQKAPAGGAAVTPGQKQDLGGGWSVVQH